MIVEKTSFDAFSKYSNLRLGAFYRLPKLKYGYTYFTDVISVIESGSRPAGGIQESDYGEAISLGGEQIGTDGVLNLDKIPYVSNDYYDSINKGKVKQGDILLCKDGALTGKVCIANTDDINNARIMVNEHVYIVRANEKYDQSFLFYVMSLPMFRKQVIDLAFRKKGQPGLNSDHIKQLRVPNISIDEQKEILAEAGPLIAKIKNSRDSMEEVSTIIDEVFEKQLLIDKNALSAIDAVNVRKVKCSDISYRNNTTRLSYRWNKALELQRKLEMLSKVKVEPLGKHVVDTQNGWSPTCSEVSSDYRVFGLDAITRSGVISELNVKYSDEDKSNFDDFVVNKGDFFISRGNTTDLVALASVVDSLDEDIKTIFPDLMIRITFDENIDIKYMAYLFNSYIGRYYFKYASKGKNQTMVKVSSAEINGFLVPVPSLKKQKEISVRIGKLLEKREIQHAQLIEDQRRLLCSIGNSLEKGI